jgi:hypothetical protein
MKEIILSGKCCIELLKDDDGSTHAIILQKTDNGHIPLYDVAVKIDQEHKDIGIQFSFDTDNVFKY